MAHSNNKDTYLATAITMIVAGLLFLTDKLIDFSSMGYGWVVSKYNLLLFASIIFLIVKSDKSVGIILFVIWAILNMGLIVRLLGHMSGYLLPVTLLVVGLFLFYLYKR